MDGFPLLMIADALGKTIRCVLHHLAHFLYQPLDVNRVSTVLIVVRHFDLSQAQAKGEQRMILHLAGCPPFPSSMPMVLYPGGKPKFGDSVPQIQLPPLSTLR